MQVVASKVTIFVNYECYFCNNSIPDSRQYIVFTLRFLV